MCRLFGLHAGQPVVGATFWLVHDRAAVRPRARNSYCSTVFEMQDPDVLPPVSTAGNYTAQVFGNGSHRDLDHTVTAIGDRIHKP